MFSQWDYAGTVFSGADPADNSAQFAEEQTGGGRTRLQVSGHSPRGLPPGLLVFAYPGGLRFLLKSKAAASLVPGVYSFFLLSVAS